MGIAREPSICSSVAYLSALPRCCQDGDSTYLFARHGIIDQTQMNKFREALQWVQVRKLRDVVLRED